MALTYDDMRRLVQESEPTWRKWARWKGVRCELLPNAIAAPGDIYAVAFVEGERAIVATPETLAAARRALGADHFSDEEFATMLAWYAEIVARERGPA